MKQIYLVIVSVIIVVVIAYLFIPSLPVAEIKKLENTSHVHWANYDSSRRGAFIWINKDSIYNHDNPVMQFCSEPFPDTGINKESSISLKNKIVDFFIGENNESKALPGRNSGVLALREALYRLCELSVNRPKINDCEIMKEYESVIGHIAMLTDSESSKNNAEADRIIASSPNYDIKLAKEAENKAFESIVDRKYIKAKEYFSKAEKYYPTLHNNFEIYSALNGSSIGDVDKSKNELIDNNEQIFLNNVVNKWSWGADADQISKIKKLLADKNKK